jgi:hypothetical protein
MLFSIDIQPQSKRWGWFLGINHTKQVRIDTVCVIFFSTRQKCAVGLIIQGVAAEAVGGLVV